MTERRKLVMATNNGGKLREARSIAGDKLEILSLSDIGFHQDIPETADTLEGNALIKVRAIKEVTGLDVFADDTGLIVDALGGAPGVYSARYAGEECDPEKNIDLLLKNLEGHSDRDARFRTCIALSLDGEEHIFEGSVEGSIATARHGDHGFGYDPVFISKETGRCFAEMSDEEKNAISHRGRAISAMMKWLSALCLLLCCAFPASAYGNSDIVLYNTFHDKTASVFDTPEKAYFLSLAQLYDPIYADNEEMLHFLFCLDKNTDELRSLNADNALSRSLISMANYNALRKYLLIVYEDLMIDILYDDGELHTIHALKNFSTSSSKEVRSITFDPQDHLAYLATDFGLIAINDQKHEVAFSCIYDLPIDYAARVGDNFLIINEGKLLRDPAASNHSSFSDFLPADWTGERETLRIIPLSSSKCLLSKKTGGNEEFCILTFTEGNSNPEVESIGVVENPTVVENKAGALLSDSSRLIQVSREGEVTILPVSSGSRGNAAGSWDLKEVFFAKPISGFYSERINSDGQWTRTRQEAKPDAPSPFRSNRMAYDRHHGMLVCPHGTDQNFTNHNAANPLLLSALSDSHWTQHGIPDFDASQSRRLINPCGFAVDPDNPDVVYFGSVVNGLIRYNIKDFSSLLHFTRSDDSSTLPGHVDVAAPYSNWSNTFMLLYPVFDRNGNLLMTHLNTSSADDSKYTAELWMWTPEKRKATVSPETYQSFKRLKINGVNPNKISIALPMQSAAAQNMVNVFVINKYDSGFVVYDHNGTPDDESDDRQTLVNALYDQDGNISFHYIYCATEDPSTGLVWVGTDNGVFTFNPALQFADNGSASRIKVNRNDGTSLADYLLDGISVNSITIDGKGRKWFSLNGGGLVCTSSDGRSVIQEINTENSSLPSDIIYTAAYNPDSNSLMVATRNGLCELYLGSAGQNGSGSEVRAYPNPVRPDYYGWVTIDGLEDDCLVKICDSAGNVVRELGPALGGSVQWDACNSRLDRVASGVYFVLASSGPGGGSYSEVTKILVVKN